LQNWRAKGAMSAKELLASFPPHFSRGWLRRNARRFCGEVGSQNHAAGAAAAFFDFAARFLRLR
jgi:hypothetical protein